MVRKYHINEDFFESINSEEKAYSLGLFVADGYMNQKTAFIALSEKDKDILEKVKEAMKNETPFSVKKKPAGKNDLLVLCMSSKKLVGDLNDLGITSNKTLTIEYPDIPLDLDRHFIRGLFDGDGYIGNHQFALTGASLDLLTSVQSKMCEQNHRVLKIGKTNNNYRLLGYKADRDSLGWLYDNNSISLYRKYKAYQDYYLLSQDIV